MCFAIWTKSEWLNVQTINKQLDRILRKLGRGDSSSPDSEMISMQGISPPAVSLPLGLAWQQQWPHLVLYLSVLLHSPSQLTTCLEFSEQIVSCDRVCCHVPSVPPLCSIGWFAGWRQSGSARLRSGLGGLTSPGLMTHGHSRIVSWPPRQAAPQ